MIELNTLTQILQDGLNQNGKGVIFGLISDGGNYVPPQRNRNDIAVYVNGVVTIVGANVYPVQGISIATQKARLELVVPLDDLDDTDTEDDEEVESIKEKNARMGQIIIKIKSTLNDYFESAKVLAIPDACGREYMVAIGYSLINSGTIEIRNLAAKSISFSAYIDYSFVENGINSYDCELRLNGEKIPYTMANTSRVPIIDNNPYTGQESAVNLVNSTSFGVELTVPATLPQGSIISSAVLDFVVRGISNTYMLDINIAGVLASVPVKIGQCSSSFEGITNASYTISLINTVEV